LVKAYQEAKALAERHPESSAAHFSLAYVLRYGGALDESAHECDSALALDPGNYQLRSCSITFEWLGKYARGMDFLQLDIGSMWVTGNLVVHDIRTGDLAQAREMSEKMGDFNRLRELRAYLNHAPPSEVERIAGETAPQILANPDAENRYTAAPIFAYSGQNEIALRLLKSGVEGHYCGYTAMQNDPMLASVRGTPEFNAILAEAKKCQSDFLAQRSQGAP
jgi:tetratricopeptide (TPR) repeat protein